MDDTLKGLVYGAFIGDALSLGAHWIYNPSKITRIYGRITDYISPKDNKYHAKKAPGDVSHYGDQTMALLQSLAAGQRWDLQEFAQRWRRMFADYSDYMDSATQQTLDNFAAGAAPDDAGSGSDDLSAVGRIAPLFAVAALKQPAALHTAVRQQTAMTHNDPGVIEAGDFFAAVVMSVLAGSDISAAIFDAANRPYKTLPVVTWVAEAQDCLELDTVEAIAKLGQTCHNPDAFPSTIYLLLKYGDDLEACLIDNVMAGGDSAARGLLIGMVLGARRGFSAIPKRWVTGLRRASEIDALLARVDGSVDTAAPRRTEKVSFRNRAGILLDARLEQPAAEPKAFALFAHCFTCSKDLIGASRISRELSEHGIAVLRFDFTGLGNSEGDFANTNFSSNVGDLVAAAEYLATHYRPPTLLIGHSLGGAAVLAAGAKIPGVKGVVTIGAPSDPSHVAHLFTCNLAEIEAKGTAEVNLSGRKFTVTKQFLDDIREQRLLEAVSKLRVASLIMHSPVDNTVSIDHAGKIFGALKHPKSFVSLHPADHLVSRKEDAAYIAEIISAWSSRIVST